MYLFVADCLLVDALSWMNVETLETASTSLYGEHVRCMLFQKMILVSKLNTLFQQRRRLKEQSEEQCARCVLYSCHELGITS